MWRLTTKKNMLPFYRLFNLANTGKTNHNSEENLAGGGGGENYYFSPSKVVE